MLGRYDARYTSFNLDRVNDRAGLRSDRLGDRRSASSDRGTTTCVRCSGTKRRLSTVRRPTSSAQWDWKHNGALPTNTAQDLAAAMAFNPNLQVFSANGYYDFATPFWATVYTLNHLTLPADLQKNISYGFYESGHMVYLHPQALTQFHDDLEGWYSRVLGARLALHSARGWARASVCRYIAASFA